MRRSVRLITLLLVLGYAPIPALKAATATDADLARRFTQTVRPFVVSYCTGCHSGATPAASFDLQQYSTMESVIRDYRHWALVLGKLTSKEMPPAPVRPPPEDIRRQVIDWIAAVRKNEALKNEGDP